MARVTGGGGFAAAIAAFAIWGLFPLYLIGLMHVSAMQITAHRIVWSCVFVLGWLAVRRELGTLWESVHREGVLLRLTASSFFIAVNWLGFAWAVNNDHVLEVSLAYFMGPLLNILLGIFVLSERLERTQWVAVGFAAAGVAYLTFIAGHAPWLALMVGSSFALYGVIRKTVSIDALPGLAVETILLVPFAAGYLIWCEAHGIGALGHQSGGSMRCSSPAESSLRYRCSSSHTVPDACRIRRSASSSSSLRACSWCVVWSYSERNSNRRERPGSCSSG